MGQLIWVGPGAFTTIPNYGTVSKGQTITLPDSLCNQLYAQDSAWWTPTGGFTPSAPPVPAPLIAFGGYTGLWNANYVYQPGNVALDANGAPWIALLQSTGVPLATGAFWQLLGIGPVGATGPPGVGASWQGAWSNSTTYALGQGVYRNGFPYISNVAGNVGHDPATDAGVNWGALFPPLVPLVNEANTFTKTQTIADTATGDYQLVLNQPAAATVHAFVVTQPSWDGNPAHSAANFVVFSLSGSPTTGPLYHFNPYGFGIVGDGTNSPPYFAIEDSIGLNYKFQVLMVAGGGTPYSVWITNNKPLVPTAATPNLTIGAGGHLYLQAGLRNVDGQSQPGGDNQYVFVQAARGLAVQNAAGTANVLVADPHVGVTIAMPLILSSRRAAVNASANPVAASDLFLCWTSLTGPVTSVIPACPAGQVFIFKDESGACSGTNTITVTVTGGGTIDGVASKVLSTPYAVLRVYYSGTTGVWFTW